MYQLTIVEIKKTHTSILREKISLIVKIGYERKMFILPIALV